MAGDEIDRGRVFSLICELLGGNRDGRRIPVNWAGETEALALAKSLPNVCVLMDDFQAREFAISVRGTLALLLMAKEKKYVQEVGPLINQLKEMGFRLQILYRILF